MPSKRFTKTNIDRDVKALVATLAAARGISETQMLEQIILFYLSKQGNDDKVRKL